MRSKAWLAASVWLWLARLAPPASRMRHSRRLRDTLAAAAGLLAHACVTEVERFCPMGTTLMHTAVAFVTKCKQSRARADTRGGACLLAPQRDAHHGLAMIQRFASEPRTTVRHNHTNLGGAQQLHSQQQQQSGASVRGNTRVHLRIGPIEEKRMHAL
jgi:hypothetical protein